MTNEDVIGEVYLIMTYEDNQRFCREQGLLLRGVFGDNASEYPLIVWKGSEPSHDDVYDGWEFQDCILTRLSEEYKHKTIVSVLYPSGELTKDAYPEWFV